ncbi:DUF3392 domain-containing protein [Ectothiorhodospira sp. BSL-9]|uniref:DUF3392 domain-containing protein n=1 Tax=Ectothiorhodospira sp. BSL-9 TaxID=1442136 RepID=UPI0009ECD729|nr:DUF3392 domain-containing protein [Ectothiorhodospira sp. BSL-9]TVQ72657.1 MAG: DUF3392 domain-containing protein [Chromatiaceae bacterium]
MMDWINDTLLQAGVWMRGYTSQIALALVATLLVVYGQDILRAVKAAVRPYPLVFRLLVFVLMCVFGFGAIAVFLAPWVAQGLMMVDTLWLAPTVAGAFLILGFIAERRQQL